MAEKIVQVKFLKVSPTANIPFHGSKYAAGYDLYADEDPIIDEYSNLVYRTGISVAIPKGYAGYLFPRSSNARTDLRLTNCVGVIDSDFRGEITMKFRRDIRQFSFWSLLKFALRRTKDVDIINYGTSYKKGERIGQLIILPTPRVQYIEVNTLDETQRGKGSYGSTGK